MEYDEDEKEVVEGILEFMKFARENNIKDMSELDICHTCGVQKYRCRCEDCQCVNCKRKKANPEYEL